MSTWRELTNDQLSKLSTPRLYTVYKLMVVSRATMHYDHFERGYDNDHEEMKAKCEFVKSILDTRDHIERDKTDPPMTARSARRNGSRRDRLMSKYGLWSAPEEVKPRHAGRWHEAKRQRVEHVKNDAKIIVSERATLRDGSNPKLQGDDK